MEETGQINIIPIRGYDFEWQIPEFTNLSEDNSSPIFSFASTLWCLKIHKDRHNKILDKGLGLYLRRKSSGPPISLDFSLGLKTVDGTKNPEVHRTHIFREAEQGFGINRCITATELLVARKYELLPSDTLTVFCTIRYQESVEDENIASLRQDYMKVLLDGQNYDLVLKVGNKEFRAHRDILRARSRVFESILSHDMMEKNNGILEVPDCDSQAMEIFLSYVYCGNVESLNESNMFGLHYIADKYEMVALKEECSEFIKKSLSLTNVCEIILLAMNHSDSNLLEYAKDYYGSNMADIMCTENWRYFQKDNLDLAHELRIRSLEKFPNARMY